MFEESKQERLILLNTEIMTLKLLEATANTHSFTAAIGDHAKTVRNKTAKLVKALEEYVTNQNSLKDKGVQVLMSQLSVNEKEREDLKKWAHKLGVACGTTSKRRRKP